MYKNVVHELLKIPEIVECHFTTGPYTMLVKLFALDNADLMELLNNKMQEIPGVVATETLISLEQSIKRGVPIREMREVPQTQTRVVLNNNDDLDC
jgi:Lrp/AsnC family transcriptional regulator for asnA, asnC and gidA